MSDETNTLKADAYKPLTFHLSINNLVFTSTIFQETGFCCAGTVFSNPSDGDACCVDSLGDAVAYDSQSNVCCEGVVSVRDFLFRKAKLAVNQPIKCFIICIILFMLCLASNSYIDSISNRKLWPISQPKISCNIKLDSSYKQTILNLKQQDFSLSK